jgi:DNA-binding NarL/FixJ family response regulator
MKALRVVVADDNSLIREGLVRVLETTGEAVVGIARNADELVAAVHSSEPDVVITDIQMPPHRGEDGLRAALQLRSSHPHVGVIVLSQFLEDDYALSLVEPGSERVGYLLKEKMADPRILHDAVRRVAYGGSALDPDVIACLVGRVSRSDSGIGKLTRRERGILALVAQGRSNSAIAAELVITVGTVEQHISNVFAKLGLHHDDSRQHRRVLAVLAYLKG